MYMAKIISNEVKISIVLDNTFLEVGVERCHMGLFQ